jgi:hypothetical protein
VASFVATLAWSLWEAGLDGWALLVAAEVDLSDETGGNGNHFGAGNALNRETEVAVGTRCKF